MSYLPISPPKWAKIPSDTELYPRPPLIRSLLPPGHFFPLGPDSSCMCASGRTMYNPTQSSTRRKAKLYTLTSLINVEIEVQNCPTCPSKHRRYIGPDLRSSGVFNYNNSILVTHELLDEYTSAFTSSETPFIAWVRHISRRYDDDNLVFMGPDLFRNVWFAYVSIQEFSNDMVCAVCGPTPDTVIWDGITAAFNKKHLKDSIRPPTTIHPSSITRGSTRYRPKQQLLLDKAIRKAVREALSGPSVNGLLEAARLETAAFGVSLSSITSPSSTPSTPLRSRSTTGIPFPTAPLTPITPVRSSSTAPVFSGSVFMPATPQPASQWGAGEGDILPTVPRFDSSTQGNHMPTTIFSSPTSHAPAQVTDSPAIYLSKDVLKRAGLVDHHLNSLRSTTSLLKKECLALGNVFEKLLGPSAYISGVRCPVAWLKQVSTAHI